MSPLGAKPRQRVVVSIRDPKSEGESVWVRRLLGQMLVAGTVLMVLFCGMFPFDFTWRTVQRFDLTLGQLWTAGDGPDNVVFFLPFGFALGSVLWARRKYWRIIPAVAISAALSLTVELSQMHLASRDPSLSDVTCNTIGGTLGFLLFAVCGEYIMRPIVRIVQFIRGVRDVRLLLIPTLVWTMLFLALPVLVRNVGSLATWDVSYPLLVGNETSNERGWKGTVANLWLSDRTLDEDQLESVLAGADPATLLKEHAVASYHFAGDGPYLDATGHSGALKWTADHPTAPGEGPSDRSGVMALGRHGEPISWAWWLRTDDALAAASDRISHSQSFTLILDAATADLGQSDRNPRIISISADAYHCNLQLCQDEDKLLVRFRSIGTGHGGTHPSIDVPGIFEDLNIRRIVLTYNYGKLLVACDRIDQRYAFREAPESWLVWRIYPRPNWRFRTDSAGQSLCSFMYRILALLPLGVLLGLIATFVRKRGNFRLPRRLIFSGLATAALVLEAVLLGICHSPAHVLGPVVSIFSGLIGAAVTARHTLLPWIRWPAD